MTINEILQAQANEAAIHAEDCSVDVTIYNELVKYFPRIFPCPDAFHVRGIGVTDCDILMVYTIQKGMFAEPLRMTLHMLFGATDWEGVLEKIDGTFVIRSLASVGPFKILFKIETDPNEYIFEPLGETATKVIGSIQPAKFRPFDIAHADVTPMMFQERVIELGLKERYVTTQTWLLNQLAVTLDSRTPVPDGIQAALSMYCDVDFIYTNDSKGQIRRKIDRYVGPSQWEGIWDKATGEFSLHTMLEIKTPQGVLRVQIIIVQANLRKEILFIQGENEDQILYRAIRPTDPDYEDILKQAGIE